MRRTFAALAFTGLLASAAAFFTILPSGGQVNAAPSASTFTIPAHDGYGIAECLSSNTDCAKVIADSWCESQGFGHAESFGLAADDPKGAVQTVSFAQHERPFAITCAQ
jgi:hypothetical protein